MNVTVSRKATGKYFVSLCVEEEVGIFPNNGGEIGIDVGIKVLPRQKAVLRARACFLWVLPQPAPFHV